MTAARTALNNLRAHYAGMSDYQAAFSFANEASYRANEVRHNNSAGMNSVRLNRLATLMVLTAKRVPAEQREQVRTLAAKYLRVARSARKAALTKNPDGYRAALHCHRFGLGNYWPAHAA